MLKEYNGQYVGAKTWLDEIVSHPNLRQNEQHIVQLFSQAAGNPIAFLQLVRQNPQFYEIALQSLMKYIHTSNRLTAIQTSHVSQPMLVQQPMMYPPQMRGLYESSALERRVHDLIKAAFGRGVSLNRASYNNLRLHYIDLEEIAAREDAGTPAFARWLEKQPLLDQQGDGIRSFCAVVITILDYPKPLILIDEPEAFLHPPQVRQLAKVIARETSRDTQMIVSTHSSDFVQGLLDYADDRVSVVRMTRARSQDAETNPIRKLDPEELASLWRDPLLKTSDLLTSLFHEVAIIVEGDSDARFFRAMLDAILEASTERVPDFRFFHCGGKDRIPKVAQALRAVGVPTVCIVDIDVIDDKDKFLQLYSSLGGEPADADGEVDQIIRYVSDHKSVMNSSDAKIELEKQFATIDPRRPLTKAQLDAMTGVLRNASAWRFVKRSGDSFFGRGAPHNAFSSLRRRSEAIGLIINEVGELENFCKTVEARKTNWLGEVLKLDLKTDVELEVARNFVSRLLETCRKVIRANVQPDFLSKEPATSETDVAASA